MQDALYVLSILLNIDVTNERIWTCEIKTKE